MLFRSQKYLNNVYGEYATFKLLDTMSSSSVYKLVPMGSIKHMVTEFRRIFYDHEKYKIVPQEILNSPHNIRYNFFVGYYAADGYKCTMSDIKNITFSNKGKIGSAQLCYLARSIGYQCSVSIRSDKPDIYRMRCTTQKLRKEPDVVKKCEVIHEAYTDYVYDIETVTGNFRAGIGDIILKNTDSCYVVFDDYKGDDLFHHSKQIDAKINKNNIYFPWPMVLEFEEEVYRQFLILKKKCYMWRTDHSDEVGKKGGMLVRRDVSRFEQMVYENVTDMIFQDATLRDITCYIMEQFNRCCGGDFPDELFTISSSVKDINEYKVRELPQDDEKRQARLDRLKIGRAHV